jgi:hypothetical protein
MADINTVRGRLAISPKSFCIDRRSQALFSNSIEKFVAAFRFFIDMSTRHTTIMKNTTSLCRPTRHIHRPFSTASRRQNVGSQTNASSDASHSQGNPEEKGAMQRRLSEMTEQAMLEGGRSARRNIEQAGFSEDLKKRLQERIAATAFKNEYPAAHSIINMPVR